MTFILQMEMFMHCTGESWHPSCNLSLQQCFLICITWQKTCAIENSVGLFCGAGVASGDTQHRDKRPERLSQWEH